MAVKTALVRQVRGITLAGKTDSNHWVMMDGPPEFGGSNAGTRPKELLLLALGGIIPFLSFILEGRVAREVRQYLAQREAAELEAQTAPATESTR